VCGVVEGRGAEMTPPKADSKEFRDIVERGCGWERDKQNGDEDCSHQYEWTCDDCPINKTCRNITLVSDVSEWLKEEKKNVRT
jgi:hypothetical protein